jgi:hypothetical protein
MLIARLLQYLLNIGLKNISFKTIYNNYVMLMIKDYLDFWKATMHTYKIPGVYLMIKDQRLCLAILWWKMSNFLENQYHDVFSTKINST